MRTLLAALLITLSTITYSAANERTLTINFDGGGEIDAYVMDIIQAKQFGVQKVIIDGVCASACVLWLHSDFAMNVCATDKAQVGWHIPYFMQPDGTIIHDPEAETYMREFSDKVIEGMPVLLKERWQSTPIPSPTGGDSPEQMNWVTGDEAVKMIGACSE